MQVQYVEVLAKIIEPILVNTSEENLCVLAMEYWSNFAKE